MRTTALSLPLLLVFPVKWNSEILLGIVNTKLKDNHSEKAKAHLLYCKSCIKLVGFIEQKKISWSLRQVVICRMVILSDGHFVSQSFCQMFILLNDHFVTRSFC
jgi:hypothetical protein